MSVGTLVSVVGVMGSGKTERLIEVKEYCDKEGVRVGVFKPLIDYRTPAYEVKSRSGKTVNCIPIKKVDEIYDHGGDSYDVILIDEIQFFDQEDLVSSLIAFTLLGIDVYVFGLDLTSDGKPFGRVGEVMAHSDDVIKLETKCNRCDDLARISHYKNGDKDEDVKVGDLDLYEPLCRGCYYLEEQGIGKALEYLDDLFDEEDELYSFRIGSEDIGVMVDIVIPKSDLEKAGYSYDDVLDISTFEGIQNLLRDIGMYDLDEEGVSDE